MSARNKIIFILNSKVVLCFVYIVLCVMESLLFMPPLKYTFWVFSEVFFDWFVATLILLYMSLSSCLPLLWFWLSPTQKE